MEDRCSAVSSSRQTMIFGSFQQSQQLQQQQTWLRTSPTDRVGERGRGSGQGSNAIQSHRDTPNLEASRWLVDCKRNPQTVSQLLAQTRGPQEKANSFSDAREFHHPEIASNSGASRVPVIPSQFRDPELCLAAILDCRLIHGILWEFPETSLNDFLLKMDILKISSKF